MQWPIVPESERVRSATRRGHGVARVAPYLVITLCGCALLASCSTTDDGIAARRDREARKLSQEKVWKSGTAQIEPQVLPAPRAPQPELDADTAGTPELAAPPNAGEATTLWGAEASMLLESSGTTETVSLAKETDGATQEGGQDPDGGARSWIGVPDEELMRELLLRKLNQWESQAGGYSHASNLAPENDERQLARELVTLSFISDGRAIDETGLEEAAMTLGATGDREDLLRAALTLQQIGRTSESEEILRRLTGEPPNRGEATPEEPALALQSAAAPATAAVEAAATVETAGPPETAATAIAPVKPAPSDGPGFGLVSVTFASRIDGPGDFVTMPAEAIERGKDVLVYGEFAGFRTIEYRAEAGDEPTHSRAFSASLRLQDAEANILEELKFLPPKRGRQFVDNPDEAVNFWARYQIPDDLGAGRYEIVITAEDHFGGQSAQAELGFALK